MNNTLRNRLLALVATAAERQMKALRKAKTMLTEKGGSRVDALERDQPMQRKTSQWVTTAVYSAAALALTFAAKSVGLL